MGRAAPSQESAPAPTPTSVQIPPASRVHNLSSPLRLERGGVLPQVQLAYESWGTLNARRDNAILLLTGLSPNAHAASSPADPSPGWWEYMLGPGRPLDSERFHIICVNALGSCYGSTGPASLDPQTGRPYGCDFPELSVEDIVATARSLVRELGIECLHAVVGASLGGMGALLYAVRYPEEVAAMVSISAAASASPFAIAIRSLQREIIRADPAWQGGNYDPATQQPRVGMRLARKLGLISYRSAEEWSQRFGRDALTGIPPAAFGPEFQIESYLEANAGKFVTSFDANSYLYLSRAMDWFDLSRHGGSLAAATARITARCLVVGVESDMLFPLSQQRELAAALEAGGKAVRFEALPSVQGHDAFLVDEPRFVPVLQRFFSSES